MTSLARAWEVRLLQLECDVNMEGCFQYYTGHTGTVTSFNFHNQDTARQVHLGGGSEILILDVICRHKAVTNIDVFSWAGLHGVYPEGDSPLLHQVPHHSVPDSALLLRLLPSLAPDGWDLDGVPCSTDCNTAATCSSAGDNWLLIPGASEDGRNPASFTG